MKLKTIISQKAFLPEEETNEAAPKMRKNKEAENIKKVYMALSGLKKGGGSGRYGKEFDSAKKTKKSKKRARNEDGSFKADDPTTPGNEAWEVTE